MRSVIPYAYCPIWCILYTVYHACSSMMTTFLFDGDDPWKVIQKPQWFPNFSASPPASSSILSCSGKCAILWQAEAPIWGVVFPSFCFCHLLKSHLFPPCSLLSRLLVTSAVAQRPLAPQQKLPFAAIVTLWDPALLKQTKNTQVAASGSELFPVSSLTPQRALPFQPSLELLGVRLQAPGKDTCFPLHA